SRRRARVRSRRRRDASQARGDRDRDAGGLAGVVVLVVVVARPQPPPDGGDAPVQRGALLERTPERLDDGVEVVVVELLAVLGTGRSRDVLVHQRAAEVVAAGAERLL